MGPDCESDFDAARHLRDTAPPNKKGARAGRPWVQVRCAQASKAFTRRT